MTDAGITALGLLGVIGQALIAAFVVVGVLRIARVPGPWRFVRETLAGSEVWLAAIVATVATAGSLFLSEIADFIPCKLCWFQRIAMYPLVLLTLVALAGDRRAARYFLPLPIVGLGVSVWHILVERGVVEDAQSCRISAPGGCATKWIEELGYITIPTLAATAFALVIVLLALNGIRGSTWGADELETETGPPPDPEAPLHRSVGLTVFASRPHEQQAGGDDRQE